MKQFGHLLQHEIRSLFFSTSTYVAAILFLSLMILLYIFLLEGYSESPKETLPSSEFFRIFWIPVFFLIPLLTMKSISEERRIGTLQALLVTPISPFSIIIAKFLSAYFFYLTLWGITLLFPLVVNLFLDGSEIHHNLYDKASVIGGFTFIALSGLTFIAIGIFSSSITKSQFIAGTISFGLTFACIIGTKLLLDFPALKLIFTHHLHFPLSYFQTFDHLEDFSQGIIDSRPIILYSTLSLLFLTLSSLILETKK